jgi:hypothetical protein
VLTIPQPAATPVPLSKKNRYYVYPEKIGRGTSVTSNPRNPTGKVVKQIPLTDLCSSDQGDSLVLSWLYDSASSSTSQQFSSPDGQSSSCSSIPPSEELSSFTPTEGTGDDESSKYPVVTQKKSVRGLSLRGWFHEFLCTTWNALVKPKEVVLFLSSDPRDQMRLRLMDEMNAVETAILKSNRKILITVEKCVACQPKDIQPGIDRYKPTTIILSCHGAKNSGPSMQDSAGYAIGVNPVVLSRLFSKAPNLKCIILNSCHSSEYAQYMANQTGASVMAFNGRVHDKEASDFSSEFLRQRGNGLSYLEAYESAELVARLTASDRFRPEMFWPIDRTSQPFAERTLRGDKLVPGLLQGTRWQWRLVELALALVVYMCTGNMADSTG